MRVSFDTDASASEFRPSLELGHHSSTDPDQVLDDEFPAGLPSEYDWMLQPASQFRPNRAKRLAAMIMAIFFVASIL